MSAADSLIYTIVDAIVSCEPKVTELLKFILSALTSKPAGAVTLMPVLKPLPATLKLADEDATPAKVVNDGSDPVPYTTGLITVTVSDGPVNEDSRLATES